MTDWRYPLSVRVYRPPSVLALAERLRVTVAELRATVGPNAGQLVCVADADGDVVSEVAVDGALDTWDEFEDVVMPVLLSHPTFEVPPGGFMVRGDEWGLMLTPVSDRRLALIG